MTEPVGSRSSAATGRFRTVSKREAGAAADARVTVDRKRGKATPSGF